MCDRIAAGVARMACRHTLRGARYLWRFLLILSTMPVGLSRGRLRSRGVLWFSRKPNSFGHQRSRCLAGISHLRSARRSRFFACKAAPCGRLRAGSDEQPQRSRGSCGATPRPEAVIWSIERRQRNGMPTERRLTLTQQVVRAPQTLHTLMLHHPALPAQPRRNRPVTLARIPDR